LFIGWSKIAPLHFLYNLLNSYLFVCTTDGVYKTSDAGNTWANITQNIGVTYAYYNSDIVIDPSNANTIFLAMAQGNNQNKVFRSTDGGDSWTN